MPFRSVVTILCLLTGLTLVGTVGFRLTRELGWLDSLYLALITLTTVGSRDAGGNTASKVFTIGYLIVGLGIFTFSAFQIGSWVVSAEFRRWLERRRMNRTIEQLSDHSIVCGQGRMGLTICKYLSEREKAFVVVDYDEDRVAELCQDRGWPFVIGDATSDETLRLAGIERARGLTTVLSTDADNLYVVLSARMLNAKLKIIARASDEKAVDKLERAGANRVVSPFSTGAVKMARIMLNPSIEDFLEIADSHGNELELADVILTQASPYVNRTLKDTDLRSRGVMVIGIHRSTGEKLMPPPGDTVLQADDRLFVFGNTEAVNAVPM